MRRVSQTFAILLVFGGMALATVFGTVRGIVHDPQHRPIAAGEVVLKAKTSDYHQKTETDVNGDFHFDAVPLGEYTVTVSGASFAGEEQSVTVLSGTAPILHFELHLASQVLRPPTPSLCRETGARRSSHAPHTPVPTTYQGLAWFAPAPR